MWPLKRNDANHEKAERERRARLRQLKKRMQGVQNEIDFVEILAQFWPLPNMSRKMERLDRQLQALSHQYRQLQTA